MVVIRYSIHKRGFQGTRKGCPYYITVDRFVGSPGLTTEAHYSQFFGDTFILSGQTFGAIKHEQDYVSTFGSSPATLYTYLLDGVIAWCNASCINEMQRNTMQIGYFLYSIARCSGNRCNNGS